ncbi:MAG: winged helix-turn-helix domain-containing protein [Herpetosiphonaceae bacterium]|nr:winged helix-turn-helix domain-containing protein [Herpetosiphonaceae bacterium]
MIDQPIPSLTIKNQDTPSRLLPWEQPILTIGRDIANDIVIDHRLASRRHARLERDEAGCYVRDLESTNGTYINGNRVTGIASLRNNDEVWVADTVIIFRDPEATMKGTPPPVVMRRMAVQDAAELRVDSAAKEVYIKGQRLDPALTAKEFQLLELLFNRKGEVISKEQIAAGVWDYEVYDYNAIDALIYRLRQRIEIDPSAPRYIVTVRGFGYKLLTGDEG